MRKLLFLFLLFSCETLNAQSPEILADSMRSGFRGLSVVSKNVIWMSGRKGLVGRTTETATDVAYWKWEWHQVKGFEKLDFRSVHGFDEKRALIVSAGTPAVILATEDGGKSWTKRFRSDDSAMFLDGIAFWDAKHGIVFGDPVKGRMFLAETFDAGKTWQEIPFAQRPELSDGEASFAASGTTIRVLAGGHVWVATGGAVSRLWHSRDSGHHWEALSTPMIQGKPSQGIFSLAFSDTLHGIIVGGDYTNDTLKENHVFYTNDGGKTWLAPKVPTGGYRSCVEYVNGPYVIATGTSGTDFSPDMGQTWFPLGKEGFNVVKAWEKDAVLAGGKLRKARVILLNGLLKLRGNKPSR